MGTADAGVNAKSSEACSSFIRGRRTAGAEYAVKFAQSGLN
jgi:hypothetical protein